MKTHFQWFLVEMHLFLGKFIKLLRICPIEQVPFLRVRFHIHYSKNKPVKELLVLNAPWVSFSLSLVGSICLFWSESSLPKGFWAQTELQWPWHYQMGALHIQIRTVWDKMLTFCRLAFEWHWGYHVPCSDIDFTVTVNLVGLVIL